PRKAARNVRMSGELEAAILRAMEKKPGDRWRSAEAFAAALDATPERTDADIPDIDVSMHESGESQTVAGRRYAADVSSKGPRTSLLRRIPMRWIVRLAAVAIVGVGGAMLWSKMSRAVRREQQQVVKKVDEAVDTAKDIFHSLAKATASPAQAARTDDA